MSFLSCMSSNTVPIEPTKESLHETCIAVFNCRLSKESGRPWVSDVIFLPQGTVLLFDKWNEKFKILGNEFMCTKSIPFKDADAFAVVSDDVIAVMASNTILLYSIKGGKLSDITVKETSFGGKGIALTHYDNYLIFLSENRDVYSSIYIKLYNYSRGGLTCHKSLEIDMKAELSPYIAISEKMKQIFLGNLDNKSVMCFSISGALLWETTLSSWPRGMAFVGDKVLVATFFDHKIHCLSGQGDYLGVVFDSSCGIRYPLALCFHKPTQRLLVQCDHFGDFKVYDISSLESLINVEN